MAARVYVLHVSTLERRSFEASTGVPPSGCLIEILGTQTLKDLHAVIFTAFGRWDNYLTEFLFHDGPLDCGGIRYDDEGGAEVADPFDCGESVAADVRIEALDLPVGRSFSYWFNLWDDWYHRIEVIAIQGAEPATRYPRVLARVRMPSGTARG